MLWKILNKAWGKAPIYLLGVSLIGNALLWGLWKTTQGEVAKCNAAELESALAASEAARRTISERWTQALMERQKAHEDALAASDALLLLRTELEEAQIEKEAAIREALRNEPQTACSQQPIGALWMLVTGADSEDP